MTKEELIKKTVADFFINSNDFNGIPLTSLAKECKIKYQELIDLLIGLVNEDIISVQSSVNPHIIGLLHFDIETQIRILNDARQNETKIIAKISKTVSMTSDSHLVCVYPSRAFLKKNRDVSMFNASPYTLELALGEPQIQAHFFEIEVLDRYYKDPRLTFEFEDYSGMISYKEDDQNKPLVRESDQVFLKTFGLGFDKDKNRVAVVFLRYLSDLTPEHQTFWKTNEITDGCKMLAEYYENTIAGNWTDSYSMFSAFLEEQNTLNKLSKAILGEPLFNKTFQDENRPEEFTFFFIPTTKNYNDFVHLLDKMISDNINKGFFKKDLDLFELNEIKPGVFERKEKGTLRLMEEWLNLVIKMEKEDGVKELVKPFRQVRSERQSPAHKINQNIYDKSLFKKQMDLVTDVYYSMRSLRHLFQKHPKAKHIEIPDWLDKGKIKMF
jgi:hypothetical protein